MYSSIDICKKFSEIFTIRPFLEKTSHLACIDRFFFQITGIPILNDFTFSKIEDWQYLI